MRLGTAALVVGLFLPACAATPPSTAEFTEQVLEPLAAKRTAEIIEEQQAQARLAASQQADADAFGRFLLKLLPVYGDALGQVLAGDPNQRLEKSVAWLETRRAPLKSKLLALFQERLTESSIAGQPIFSLCYMGTERRYARAPGFHRLENSADLCPKTNITLTD